jgi:hypothetical protein
VQHREFNHEEREQGMKEIWKKSEKDTAGKLSVVSLQASWKKPY